MKVYELMHLLGACPAGAEVRVAKVLDLGEFAELMKDCAGGTVEVSGTVIDFDKRTAVTENDTVELYLD